MSRFGQMVFVCIPGDVQAIVKMPIDKFYKDFHNEIIVLFV